jgi:hypothetical protein
MLVPIPPWTQRILLSINTPKGKLLKIMLILEKIELFCLILSPSLFSHSSPKPSFILIA